jgi:TRAP-type transport system periplasmic protein
MFGRPERSPCAETDTDQQSAAPTAERQTGSPLRVKWQMPDRVWIGGGGESVGSTGSLGPEMSDSEDTSTAQHIHGYLDGTLTRRKFGKMAAMTAIAVACGGQTASPQEGTATSARLPKTWRLGHATAIGNHNDIAAHAFAETLREKTKGGITVSVYPTSQLGGDVQMIEAVRSGIQEVWLGGSPPLSNTVKELTVFDLPYLFANAEQADKLLKGKVGQTFLNLLPKYNLQGLGFLAALERNVYSTKKSHPIRNLSDLQNFRIRVQQAQGYILAYKALGASPVPLQTSEEFLAMQQNLVDGGQTTPDFFMQMHYDELCQSYSLTKVHINVLVFAINKQVYDALPADQRKAVTEAAQAGIDADILGRNQAEQAAYTAIKGKGLQVINIDIAPFVSKAAPAKDQILSTIPNGRELYNMIVKETGLQ